MKVYKALFAIILASVSLMSAGAITRAELKKFPVHYTTVPYGEMFTKFFRQDARGRYTVKGEKPLLLVINIKGCGPCISARLFLNWMVDYHRK